MIEGHCKSAEKSRRPHSRKGSAIDVFVVSPKSSKKNKSLSPGKGRSMLESPSPGKGRRKIESPTVSQRGNSPGSRGPRMKRSSTHSSGISLGEVNFIFECKA